MLYVCFTVVSNGKEILKTNNTLAKSMKLNAFISLIPTEPKSLQLKEEILSNRNGRILKFYLLVIF